MANTVENGTAFNVCDLLLLHRKDQDLHAEYCSPSGLLLPNRHLIKFQIPSLNSLSCEPHILYVLNFLKILIYILFLYITLFGHLLYNTYLHRLYNFFFYTILRSHTCFNERLHAPRCRVAKYSID